MTGILLAGGKSSRMQTNKEFLFLGGKTLLTIGAEKLNRISEKILISTNNPIILKTHDNSHMDDIQNIGPIGGIYTCLKHSKSKLNVITSVDTPFASTSLFEYLTEKSAEYDITVASSKGEIQPLAGIYSTEIIPKLTELIENKEFKMHNIIKNFKLNIVEINENLSFFHEHLFFNVNTPQDYHKALEIEKIIHSI